MGAFEYTALDAAGRERKGILEGDTPRHIRQLLREQQLLPVTVTEVAQKEATRQKAFSFARKVSAADLALFTRQLATLVRAGLPLEESLLAVSQQTEKPRVQSIVHGVRAKVMEGHTLAAGFAECVPYREQIEMAEMPVTSFEINPAYVQQIRQALVRR